jgi:hypothetical protein
MRLRLADVDDIKSVLLFILSLYNNTLYYTLYSQITVP